MERTKKEILEEAIEKLYRARVGVSMARCEIDPDILSDDAVVLLDAWEMVDMAINLLERMK